MTPRTELRLAPLFKSTHAQTEGNEHGPSFLLRMRQFVGAARLKGNATPPYIPSTGSEERTFFTQKINPLKLNYKPYVLLNIVHYIEVHLFCSTGGKVRTNTIEIN